MVCIHRIISKSLKQLTTLKISFHIFQAEAEQSNFNSIKSKKNHRQQSQLIFPNGDMSGSEQIMPKIWEFHITLLHSMLCYTMLQYPIFVYFHFLFLLSLFLLLFYFTSGIPWAENALQGGTTSLTASYPGGGGSDNDVLKIYWERRNKNVKQAT